MQRLALTLIALLLLIGPLAQAGDHPGAKRFAITIGIGSFDEQGSDVMLRKDAEPGNPIVGWKGSDQVGAGLGYDVLPGVTLDLSYARLDYDFGTDVVTTQTEGEFVSTQIATGSMDEYRLTVMLDMDLLSDHPTYYVSPQRKAKWRFAVFSAVAFTQARDVNVADAGRQLLGIDDIDTGSQSSAGFGARMDYRFGRSAVTIGADVGWMWKLSGDLFTITTTPDSLYSGTTLRHQGLNFVIGLSYHL
jgi:opacity protein-like surface antigen